MRKFNDGQEGYIINFDDILMKSTHNESERFSITDICLKDTYVRDGEERVYTADKFVISNDDTREGRHFGSVQDYLSADNKDAPNNTELVVVKNDDSYPDGIYRVVRADEKEGTPDFMIRIDGGPNTERIYDPHKETGKDVPTDLNGDNIKIDGSTLLGRTAVIRDEVPDGITSLRMTTSDVKDMNANLYIPIKNVEGFCEYRDVDRPLLIGGRFEPITINSGLKEKILDKFLFGYEEKTIYRVIPDTGKGRFDVRMPSNLYIGEGSRDFQICKGTRIHGDLAIGKDTMISKHGIAVFGDVSVGKEGKLPEKMDVKGNITVTDRDHTSKELSPGITVSGKIYGNVAIRDGYGEKYRDNIEERTKDNNRQNAQYVVKIPPVRVVGNVDMISEGGVKIPHGKVSMDMLPGNIKVYSPGSNDSRDKPDKDDDRTDADKDRHVSSGEEHYKVNIDELLKGGDLGKLEENVKNEETEYDRLVEAIIGLDGPKEEDPTDTQITEEEGGSADEGEPADAVTGQEGDTPVSTDEESIDED